MKERGTEHPCTPEQWKFPGGTFLVIEIMDEVVWVALISDVCSCDVLSCETISFLYLLVYSIHLVYFALWP